MASTHIPMAYTFHVETPSQLVDTMTKQGVVLPVEISLNQMGNIRFIILTRRCRDIPFDIVQIDGDWFVSKVLRDDLRTHLKQGDRLLIIHKTIVSSALSETDIFKLILYSSVPFIIWVTWQADTFLKYQVASRRSTDEIAFVSAKAYLLKTRSYEEISLYDSMSLIVANAIQNPSENFLDRWERAVQASEHIVLHSNLRSAESKIDLTLTRIHAQLLEGKQRDSIKPADYKLTGAPHLMELAYFCSSAGYGIHSTEMILLESAMKRLNDRIQCNEMKFWGKLFGLHCDYYVVQVQHDEELLIDEVDIIRRSVTRTKREEPSHADEIPSEAHGIGTNQYSYFVTNSPGLPWVKLPDVKPAMIVQARKLRRLLKGCLSSAVHGCPSWIGVEKDYLRAQIARITASTHISPAGFYILSDAGEEGEETISESDEVPRVQHNPEFNNDPNNRITAELLANADRQEWVHSLPEILPQGRTRFWLPPSIEAAPSSVEDEDDEGTRSETFVENANIMQIPAPLLQPIGDDASLYTDQMSWSIGRTMSVMHEYSLCYVRSNVWPGAFTLGHAGNFFNVYVGWGQKYEGYQPMQPSAPAMEYAPDSLETNDPSVDQENAREEARESQSEDLMSEAFASDEELSSEDEHV